MSNSLFSYANLAHAIAGGCGSAVAMTAFYPLDVVRTKQQLSKASDKKIWTELSKIYENNGMEGLYKGLKPVVQSLYCSNFVYFYSFHGLNRIWNEEQNILKNLILGMIAGSINVLATTPLWVVNTRIKMQGKATSQDEPTRKYTGLLDGLREISKTEGMQALWSGTLSSLILVTNPAIQYTVYEKLKKHILQNDVPMNAGVIFSIGAISKVIATILTYPLQLVQTIHRHGDASLSEKSLASLLIYIVKLHGPKGLYKGLQAKLLQTVLTTALMFVCYEKIQAFVLKLLTGYQRTITIKKI